MVFNFETKLYSNIVLIFYVPYLILIFQYLKKINKKFLSFFLCLDYLIDFYQSITLILLSYKRYCLL